MSEDVTRRNLLKQTAVAAALSVKVVVFAVLMEAMVALAGTPVPKTFMPAARPTVLATVTAVLPLVVAPLASANA